MISQIVEARPEELRAFLEEAAGISRYKERRRETENRIRHTRENLERLADLREEVGKQLEKLKRQARAAERYRKLKARYREDEARLTALRWRENAALADSRQKDLQQVENQLQSALADQREAEKRLESLRQDQHQAGDVAAKIQAELYEVAGEIARLEQAIEHQRELRQRQESEHADTERQLNELQQHLVLDKAQVSQTTELIARLAPELEQARTDEQNSSKALEEAEQGLVKWQQRWQEHQQGASQTANRVELLRQRIEHFDDRMSRAAERLKNLGAQGDDSVLDGVRKERAQAAGDAGQAEQALNGARSAVEQGRERLKSLRSEIETLRNQLELARAERHERSARLESLRVLNQPGEDAPAIEWLANAGQDPQRQLLGQIRVPDTRWTAAVEHVLSQWLRAVEVEQLDTLLTEAPPAPGVSLYSGISPENTTPTGLATLVEGAGALQSILATVECAESLEQALARKSELKPGESLITPDGTWVGNGWLRQPVGETDESGFLQRQEDIRRLEQALEEDARRIAELEQSLASARASLEQTEQQQRDAERNLHQAERESAQSQARVTALDNRIEAIERQRKEAADEIRALRERQDEDTRAVSEARAQLQQALDDMQNAEQDREPLRAEKNELDQARERARSEYRRLREQREALSLKLESSRAGLESLRQAITRIDNQVGQLQGRFVELSEALAQGDEPVKAQQRERDRLLENRLAIETRLRDARRKLEDLEASWREQDQKRQTAAAAAEDIRARQQQLQLGLHELHLKADSLAERIEQLGANREELLAALPDQAQAQEYQHELEALEERIRKLEPVNLAAIEEHETESERKAYLDRQHADLEEALETLEKAINRIDKDSRTRFRETFEEVNRNMEALFPRLFGGGHGHLEMVGEDWLSAGVAIMARPPGKRIARIHLMSGGEKALTAVAFVFSIFNLNPAPFCLLDEVDAPLDDANVGRFSDMVREMSEHVQFLLVTHNKVTMEVAHQMLGVTMREPGVSRIVSVDLDKAVELAES